MEIRRICDIFKTMETYEFQDNTIEGDDEGRGIQFSMEQNSNDLRAQAERAKGRTLLTRGNLEETCRTMAKKETNLIIGMLVMLVFVGLLELYRNPGKGIALWLVLWLGLAAIFLWGLLQIRKRAGRIMEKVQLGQFRLLYGTITNGNHHQSYEVNGNRRKYKRNPIGCFGRSMYSEDCYLLMIDGEPEVAFPTKNFDLGSDLEGMMTDGSTIMAE